MQQLVGLIKLPALTNLPGSVSIVILKGLGSIAAQRPQYLGRILPTLLSLASNLEQPQVLVSVAFRGSDKAAHMSACFDLRLPLEGILSSHNVRSSSWYAAVLGSDVSPHNARHLQTKCPHTLCVTESSFRCCKLYSHALLKFSS